MLTMCEVVVVRSSAFTVTITPTIFLLGGQTPAGVTAAVTTGGVVSTTWNVTSAVPWHPLVSVAWTLKVKVPSDEGVPVRWPSGANVSPAGNRPLVIPNRYGANPPLAVNASE